MTRFSKALASVFLLLSLIGCDAALTPITNPDNKIVETGNPPAAPKPRKVVGTVTKMPGNTCRVDTVEFFDTADKIIEAPVDSDCAFETNLKSEKSWGLRVSAQGVPVAEGVFRGGNETGLSAVYFLSESSAILDLGEIVVIGDSARTTENPLDQNDADSDGLTDFEDDDDDNDGILDKDEPDCDHDRVRDDFDLTRVEC